MPAKTLFVITDFFSKKNEKDEMLDISEATESLIRADASKDEFAKWLYKHINGKGGSIVLSTDVNVNDVENTSMKDWILNKFHTFKNRFSAKKMLNAIRLTHSVNAWTIGRYFEGIYTSEFTGGTYDEKSIVISILDCDRKTLFSIAQDIRAKFKQEVVLVYDADTKQVYFVSNDKK